MGSDSGSVAIAMSAPIPVAKSNRANERFTTTILFIFWALAYLDKKLITFLVDPIRKSLRIDDLQMSMVTGAAFVIFYIAFSLPIGWAVDRYARKTTLFVGVTLWSVSAVMGGLSRGFGQLLVTRFGVGAGEAVLGPAGNLLIMDIVPRERLTRAISIASSGVLVGSGLSFWLGGLLLSYAQSVPEIGLPIVGRVASWQFVMILTGLPGLLLAPLVLLVREHSSARVSKRASGGVGRALRLVGKQWRFYLFHFVGFSLISVVMAGFAGWMPTYMMRVHHVTSGKLGVILAGIQLAFGAIGFFVLPVLVDRMFKAGRLDAHLRFFAWAALLLGIGGLLVGLAPGPGAAYAGIAIVDSMTGFLPVACAALLLTTAPAYRGQITALFLIVYNLLGQGVGPSVVAAITDLGFHDEQMLGYSLALTMGVAAPLASACLFAGMRGMRAAIIAERDQVTHAA